MFRRTLFALICLAAACGGSAFAAPSSPAGYWVTADGGGVVQIAQCNSGLCGRLIGIVLDTGTKMPVDWQGQSECGLQLLEPSQADAQGTWHGRIVNPRNGNAYQVEFRIDHQDQLRLRGYIGLPLFGQTQIWHRFEGAAPTSCRLTPGQVAAASPHSTHGRL